MWGREGAGAEEEEEEEEAAVLVRGRGMEEEGVAAASSREWKDASEGFFMARGCAVGGWMGASGWVGACGWVGGGVPAHEKTRMPVVRNGKGGKGDGGRFRCVGWRSDVCVQERLASWGRETAPFQAGKGRFKGMGAASMPTSLCVGLESILAHWPIGERTYAL